MKRYSAILAALLLCAPAHGQNASSSAASSTTAQEPANENTLDSAHRELKELPAAERSRDLLAKPSSLNSSLPTLALPGETSARPDPNQPPSATWLQDSIDQVGNTTNARRRAADSVSSRDRDVQPGGYKPVETPNPLGQYLEQWISPRDLELLRAGQDNKAPGADPSTALNAGNRQPSLKPLAGESPLSDSFAPTGGSNPVVPMMGATRNPYIEEPDSSIAQPVSAAPFSQPTLGPSPTDRTRAPGLMPLGSVATPATSKQPATLRPATPSTTAPAQPQRPPTALIVDDRKYFPQLRRF